MPFADLELARRLEATEAASSAQFADARRRLQPETGAAWINVGGATVTFDGIDSPITQTFGLGLFEPLTAPILDEIEAFFHERGAPIHHEVCPLAGVAALDLLCQRGYRPIEITSVMHQPVCQPGIPLADNIRVHQIGPDEVDLWSDVGAHAWSHSYPAMFDFIHDMGRIFAARADGPSFLATLDGTPAATASLLLHHGVALFAGAATLPAHRRRGLQSALLQYRMAHAAALGCDLAMMCAEAGGESQRNAERNGFRLAYTRLKWKLLD